MRLNVLGSVACALLMSASLHAETVEIGAFKDNTLIEDALGFFSNGAGEHMFAGQTNSNGARRAILAFDVAGAVPAGSTITSATLHLNVSMTSSGPYPMTVHRVLADWGEEDSHAPGNEGGGDLSEPGDATWLHTFFPDQFWASPGGDFVAKASAETEVWENNPYQWTGKGLVADVQAWLDDPKSNFGWILKSLEGPEFQTSKRFDSRQHPDPSVRPRLVLEFDAPAVCVGDLNGDTVVDTIDLLNLLGAWGPCESCAQDLNDDDIVDTIDLLALLGAWGDCK